jgi:hypothetical protein
MDNGSMIDKLKAFYQLFSLTEDDVGKKESMLKLIGTFDSPLMRKISSPNVSDDDAFTAINSSPNMALASFLVFSGADMVAYAESFEEYHDLLGNDIGELGCGAGVFSVYMASAYPALTVTGVDREKSSIKTAERIQKRVGCKNCAFVCERVGSKRTPHVFSGLVGLNFAMNQIMESDQNDAAQVYEHGAIVMAPIAWMLPEEGWYLGSEMASRYQLAGALFNGALFADLVPVHCKRKRLEEEVYRYSFLLQKHTGMTEEEKRKVGHDITQNLENGLDW